jgi:hypothetical protein
MIKIEIGFLDKYRFWLLFRVGVVKILGLIYEKFVEI